MKKYVAINDIYPIGSIYISSTNTSPSSLFGGEWTLINKSFRSENNLQSDGNLFIPTSGTLNNYSIGYSRGGNSISIRFSFNTAKELNDSDIELGSFNITALRIIEIPYTLTHFAGFSDVGNCTIIHNIHQNGKIYSSDIIGTKTTLAVNSNCTTNFTLTLPHTLMIDDFCNEFHWKRVS